MTRIPKLLGLALLSAGTLVSLDAHASSVYQFTRTAYSYASAYSNCAYDGDVSAVSDSTYELDLSTLSAAELADLVTKLPLGLVRVELGVSEYLDSLNDAAAIIHYRVSLFYGTDFLNTMKRARFAAAGGGGGAELSRTAELTRYLPIALDVSDADVLTLEFEGDELVDCVGFTGFDQGMAKTFITTGDPRHAGWGPVLVVP